MAEHQTHTCKDGYYEQMPQEIKDDTAIFWNCWDCGDESLTEAIDAFECSLKYGCSPIVTNLDGTEED